jgi:flagellar motility protein MotE (MotC chaperone)
MFNRKIKEEIEYLYAKIRKLDRLEKYIINVNERIDELEGKKYCQCESEKEKK